MCGLWGHQFHFCFRLLSKISAEKWFCHNFRHNLILIDEVQTEFIRIKISSNLAQCGGHKIYLHFWNKVFKKKTNSIYQTYLLTYSVVGKLNWLEKLCDVNNIKNLIENWLWNNRCRYRSHLLYGNIYAKRLSLYFN